MPTSVYFAGILCVTYLASRIVGLLFRGLPLSNLNRLIAIHLASAAGIVAVITYLRVYNPQSAFPYLPFQLLWFGFDWARGYRPRTRGRFRNPLRGKAAGLIVAAAMTVIGLIYIVRGVMFFSLEGWTLGPVALGARPADVIYAAGKPAMVRDAGGAFVPAGDPPAGREWLFASPRTLVRFGPTGGVESILCVAPRRPTDASCYPTLMVAVGNGDGQMIARLGYATAEGTSEGKLVARYPEIGHDFVLTQFRIEAIRVYPQNGDWRKRGWRLFRYLLP